MCGKKTAMKNFPGPVRSPRMLNVIYLQYLKCSLMQKIQQKAKCGR